MDMEVLIATKNKGKIKKYSTMLDVLNIKYKNAHSIDPPNTIPTIPNIYPISKLLILFLYSYYTIFLVI